MEREEKWLLAEKYSGIASPAYEADRTRLFKGEPLAYVIGSQPFLGLKIYLDSKPLIPRTETEWWVEQLIADTIKKIGPARSSIRFLDLCSGSGAIGCAALKLLTNAEVYFGEIDPAHEATIQKNIQENDLDVSRAHIGIGDLFEPFGDMGFDLIAANPPYVPLDRELPASVAAYEPPHALFAGPDGLTVISLIAKELPHRLTQNGVAWIECDRGHAEAAQALFLNQGLQAQIRTDQYGMPRIIVVSFP
jgi:release factor glutamine methyltransferase